MIRHKDVTASWVDLLHAFAAHANETHRQKRLRPDLRQPVLHIAIRVEQRSDQRHRPQHDGGKQNQWNGEEPGARKTHRFAPIIARASATKNSDPVIKIASSSVASATSASASSSAGAT